MLHIFAIAYTLNTHWYSPVWPWRVGMIRQKRQTANKNSMTLNKENNDWNTLFMCKQIGAQFNWICCCCCHYFKCLFVCLIGYLWKIWDWNELVWISIIGYQMADEKHTPIQLYAYRTIICCKIFVMHLFVHFLNIVIRTRSVRQVLFIRYN